MPLSPIAQYCIRKLLRQTIENLNSLFLSDTLHSNLSDHSIDLILNHLSLASAPKCFKTAELELLTKFYQQIEQNQADAEMLAEIKRRILQTLGFQVSAMLPNRLPPIVQESSIEKFCFFHHDRVQEGMRYENALFAAVYQFNSAYRLQAYQIAWVLSEAKVPLLLSLSPTRFVVWVNLQSPTYVVLSRRDAKLLKTVLSLNSALRKWQAITSKHPKSLSPTR